MVKPVNLQGGGPLPMDERYPGEAGVHDLLQRLGGWKTWSPPKTRFSRRRKSGGVDIFGAGDIAGIRAESPLLLAQVGGAGDGALRKIEQVTVALEGVYTVGSPLAEHFRPQVWSWNVGERLGPHWEVWEWGLSVTATPRGVRGAKMKGDWIRIGSCDRNGVPLVGREQWARWLWPLVREG